MTLGELHHREQHANLQHCTAAVLRSLSRVFKHKMLIRGNQRSETLHGLPNQTARNCLAFHCIGRHPSDRDASDIPGPISSNHLHPRARQNKAWSAQLQVQSRCEKAWAWDRKDAIFYSELHRRSVSTPVCVNSAMLYWLCLFFISIFGHTDLSLVFSRFFFFFSILKLHHRENTAISPTKRSVSGTAGSHISALVVLVNLRSKPPQLQ